MQSLLGHGRTQAAIYALALFALGAIIVWRVGAILNERNQLVAAAQAETVANALSVADYSDRALDVANLMAESVLQYIRQRGGLGAIPKDELQQYIAGVTRQTSMHDYLMIVDATGRPVVRSERRDVPSVSLADRAWFRAMAGGAESFVGEAVRSRLGRHVIYTFSRRISDANGKFAGAVDVAINAGSVLPVSARKPGQLTVQLWTVGGRLILSNFMDFDTKGDPVLQVAPFRELPVPVAGTLGDTDGEQLTAYQRSSGRPLVAVVTARRSEVLAGWRSRVRDSTLLLFAAVLVLGLLVWLASRYARSDQKTQHDLEATTRALSGALAQRNLLIKEIHHRVKNNLQVTSSLIEMQAHQFSDEGVRAAFKRTQQRLFAISMVHDVLYGADAPSTVDAQDYLNRLCAEIARANGAEERGIVLALELESIELQVEQATPLGLCLSEVLVNSFKHGFPNDHTGRIDVQLHAVGDDVSLTVHDNGIGYESKHDQSKSLGMRLIRALTLQLGGHSSFTGGAGTPFRITFKKRDASAPAEEARQLA